MEEQRFDTFAKDIGSSAGTRRRALQVVGAVLASAGLPAVFPEPAAAGARKRCRRKGGRYVSHGTCHCAPTCVGNDPAKFHCRSDGCYCYQTLEGDGFCASIVGNYSEPGCQSTSECKEGGKRCVPVLFPSNCPACPCGAGQACIDGVCRSTYCVPPCPDGG